MKVGAFRANLSCFFFQFFFSHLTRHNLNARKQTNSPSIIFSFEGNHQGHPMTVRESQTALIISVLRCQTATDFFTKTPPKRFAAR